MATDDKMQNLPKNEQTPKAKDILDNANQIIDAALDGVKAESPAVRAGEDGGSVSDSFKGLPMRDLIGGPLIAAAEAQQNLASIAWDFYQKIAFEADGENKGKTRIVNFTLNRPIEVDGEMKMTPQKIEAPFIGLVPIPSLLIDRIDVDFQMEVTDTNVEKTNTSSEVSSKISGGWWVTKAEISGKVSSARENTRTTNQTAKYQVHVTASQQPQTEGLSKLMDIMASCIEPVAVKSGS